MTIGGQSLYQNGVSATDGGFLQILTTTTTSEALHRAASAAALGGGENVPEELKRSRVRYGELTGSEEIFQGEPRTVGFGVEDEVAPIRKGVKYDNLSGASNVPSGVISAESRI